MFKRSLIFASIGILSFSNINDQYVNNIKEVSNNTNDVICFDLTNIDSTNRNNTYSNKVTYKDTTNNYDIELFGGINKYGPTLYDYYKFRVSNSYTSGFNIHLEYFNLKEIRLTLKSFPKGNYSYGIKGSLFENDEKSELTYTLNEDEVNFTRTFDVSSNNYRRYYSFNFLREAATPKYFEVRKIEFVGELKDYHNACKLNYSYTKKSYAKELFMPNITLDSNEASREVNELLLDKYVYFSYEDLVASNEIENSKLKTDSSYKRSYLWKICYDSTKNYYYLQNNCGKILKNSGYTDVALTDTVDDYCQVSFEFRGDYVAIKFVKLSRYLACYLQTSKTTFGCYITINTSSYKPLDIFVQDTREFRYDSTFKVMIGSNTKGDGNLTSMKVTIDKQIEVTKFEVDAEGYHYIVINLGDIINDYAKLTHSIKVEFNIDSVVYSKEFSIMSLLHAYYSTESESSKVADLYEYLLSQSSR